MDDMTPTRALLTGPSIAELQAEIERRDEIIASSAARTADLETSISCLHALRSMSITRLLEKPRRKQMNDQRARWLNHPLRKICYTEAEYLALCTAVYEQGRQEALAEGRQVKQVPPKPFVYQCAACGRSDYLNCDRPDCLDGR